MTIKAKPTKSASQPPTPNHETHETKPEQPESQATTYAAQMVGTYYR